MSEIATQFNPDETIERVNLEELKQAAIAQGNQEESQQEVAEPQEQPVPGEPYQTSSGWQVEIVLEGDTNPQVFKDKTLKGLIGKLTKAQEHASRKIRDLNKKLKEGVAPLDKVQPVAELKAEELGEEQKFLIAQKFQTDPQAAIAEITKSLYGAEPKDIREAIQTVRNMAAEQKRTAEAQKFLTEHPEYVNNTENEKAMTGYLQKNGLAVTARNLEAAYEDLTEAGLLTQDTPPEKRNTEPISRKRGEIAAPTVQKRATVGISSRQSTIDDDETGQPNEPDVEELLKIPYEERRRRIAAELHKQRTQAR